jgi:type I restriction enzyme M protein
MFYTVTLPATLWFFDKGKRDDNILFIDARNVFTQIDRAHREFSAEQIRNLALIPRLHQGQRDEFTTTVDDYFAQGFAKLAENRAHIAPLCERLTQVLDDADGKAAVSGLQAEWNKLDALQARYAQYRKAHSKDKIDAKNAAQRELHEGCDPFFAALHEDLKRLDKLVRAHEKKLAEAAQAEGRRNAVDRDTKALKSALEALTDEVRSAEQWFTHVRWLQERFPRAAYEDVTGLCKLATPADLKEQDYSLNPGRYVGVVIEEDGMTESEFFEEFTKMNEELRLLAARARALEIVVDNNSTQLCER